MRVSEIVDLKLSDLDLEEGLVRFVGKGNKENNSSWKHSFAILKNILTMQDIKLVSIRLAHF